MCWRLVGELKSKSWEFKGLSTKVVDGSEYTQPMAISQVTLKIIVTINITTDGHFLIFTVQEFNS